MNEIYHEKQSKELCALHALNNIFQIKDAFSQVGRTVENSDDKLFKKDFSFSTQLSINSRKLIFHVV